MKLLTVYNKVLTFKRRMDVWALIGIVVILLFRVPALRAVGKSIICFMTEKGIQLNLSALNAFCIFIENVILLYLLIWIVILCSMRLFSTKWTSKLPEENGDNAFEESALRYINDKHNSHCFLISGRWGSGKTYVMNNFVDKYLNPSNIRVYRVSCYGLDSRSAVINELNTVIKEADNTFAGNAVEVIKNIPIVGEALYQLFKRRYSYNTVNRNSIFIFDDFERIGSNPKYLEMPIHGNGKEYASFSSQINTTVRGLDEINKSIIGIDKGVKGINNVLHNNFLYEQYNKYTSVVGLINELVEIYEMKVFVLCNTCEMNQQFISDTFTNKLNCIEYKKVVHPGARKSIIEDVIHNKYGDEIEKKNRINEYLEKISEQASTRFLGKDFEDLRSYSNIFEAFVYTSMIYDENQLTTEFLSSLLNTIIIGHKAYYHNKVERLGRYETGSNIKFDELLFESSNANEYISLNGNCEEWKWMGSSAALFWIDNSYRKDDLNDSYQDWKEYKYHEDEEKLLSDYQHIISMDQMDIQHILLYVKYPKHTEDCQFDYSKLLDMALGSYDLSDIDTISYIINYFGSGFGMYEYKEFEEALFEKLFSEGCSATISVACGLADRYNDFINKMVHGNSGAKKIY
ncbi:MAG: hypothetical protein KBS56_05390 [Clostridiales bacterium]|nr:hypothetical protein [Candidatus Crickella equi]